MKIRNPLFRFVILLLIVAVWAARMYMTTPAKSGGSVISAQTTLAPTPIPVDPAFESATAKCHAVHVDASDPQAFLPDSACTPGVTDPAVTQADIAQTICNPGYTATVRPPADYTDKLKRQQIGDYGYTDSSMHDFEEDHLISLELGGDPRDPKNLWPEPHASFNEKDKVENYLHEQVCSGAMTLAQAQKEITANWYEIFKIIK
jgi:hypothetical protein